MTSPDPPEPTPNLPASLAGAPTVMQGEATLMAPIREGPGTKIGPYKLLQLIGEGGFGSVFMAQQEQPVQRRVALKIIKLGMDTHQVVARFEQERQALAVMDHPGIARVQDAVMDHPGIARVLDAGATDLGRPYFVMELVKGEAITEYCDRNKMAIPDRVQLLAQVSLAVQHAHSKGIIHRDLKPSNILVSAQENEPHAKVIDFGIAKATAGGLSTKTLYTEHRQLIGTPEYMSPEQAEGSMDIDTRTDVYSLGVLLYELLTGTTPHESQALRSAALGDMPRMIRELEAPKPSMRVSAIGGSRTVLGRALGKTLTPTPMLGDDAPSLEQIAKHRRSDSKSLVRSIRRELDWIVMKALEKDRTRRYASASEFAADLQRYLKNEPVMAGPPSASYRFKKFVVRHKFGATAAALVVLALALGVAGTTVALFRAVRAEKLAVTEAEKAARQARISEEALRFLVGLFAVVDPSEARGNTVTAREILDKGAARVGTELSGQPEAQATLMATMGTVYRSLGLYDAAEPLYKNALAQRRLQFKGPSAEVADTLNNYATLLVKKAEFDAAEPLYREALTMRRAVFGEEHAAVGETLNDLAYLLSQKGDFTAAEPLYRQAQDMRRRLLGEESEGAADTLHNLAMNLYEQGDMNAPVPLLRDALRVRRKLFGQVHPDVSESLNSLAYVLYNRGELDQAQPLFREALDIQKKLVGEVHPDVAMAMNNFAFVLHDSGDLDGAEAIYREVLVMDRTLLGEDHPDIAKVLNNLAAVLHDKKDLAQAEKYARDSLAMYRRVHGNEHPSIAQGLNNLARWLQEKGDMTEAEALSREALAMRRRLLGDIEIEDLRRATKVVARTLFDLLQ